MNLKRRYSKLFTYSLVVWIYFNPDWSWYSVILHFKNRNSHWNYGYRIYQHLDSVFSWFLSLVLIILFCCLFQFYFPFYCTIISLTFFFFFWLIIFFVFHYFSRIKIFFRKILLLFLFLFLFYLVFNSR